MQSNQLETILNSYHIEDTKNKKHPSIFFHNDVYNLFILRIPQLKNKKDIIFESFAFIITKNSYFYYDRKSSTYINLNTSEEFYNFIDSKIDIIIQIIDDYMKKFEKYEDIIYSGKTIKDFNTKWFKDKNILIRSNRLLYKAQEVFQNIVNKYQYENDYLKHHFEDLGEHFQRTYRHSGLLLEKLDALYNFNNTYKNEQMNRIMYILTILSGIFLPLNLIVGFFGMNTTDLPFTKEIAGTSNVVLVLVLSAIITTILSIFITKKNSK